MKVYHDLSDLPIFTRAVITIGSFDGVHLGHQQIINRINSLAQEIDGESIVITFHPHPRLVLYPDDTSLRMLTTIDEKVKLLESLGVDNVVIVPFNRAFADQSAQSYIENFLIKLFTPSYIVIGYDHRFGKNREGDMSYLQQYASKHQFKIIQIEKEEVEDIAVSSSKIRQALHVGDVHTVYQLLGHRFTLSGVVVHGQQIGRTIGYPTANISVSNKHKLIPPEGIYAVEVIHQVHRYRGMLYIGKRPTIEGDHKRSIEVNIFDFDQEIYGDKLTLIFVDYIRSDRQLDGLDGLRVQLGEDEKAVKAVLEHKVANVVKKAPKVYPKVAVIILNYNGQAFLEQYLQSVVDSTYPNMDLHIADNASTDDSIDWLIQHHPDLTIHSLSENYGFAQGYNVAIERIEADYFVLLNSDVEVTTNWLEPIIELMEKDPTIGACQPKIRSLINREQFEYAGAAGGWMDYLGYPFCRGRIFYATEQDKGQYDQAEEVFWASGAAMFIRPKLMKGLGGFDGDYFAHLEEIDLCWRIKQAGFKVMSVPKSVVYHYGGGTLQYDTPRKAYLNFRNSLYTLLKNEPVSKLLWLIPTRLVLDGLAALRFLSEGKWAHIRAILRAHGAFYANFNHNYKKRYHNQDNIQKVSISQTPNQNCIYPKSIVWQFFIRRRKRFQDL